MSDPPALERLLRRDRTIIGLSLALLWALCWLYLIGGAGLGMDPVAPAQTSPSMPMEGMAMPGMDMAMPGQAMDPQPHPAVAWSLSLWALTISMWWLMMLAMMTPSAAPAILLYGRVERHAQAGPAAVRVGSMWAFAAGYFLIWLGFSVAAAVVQWVLAKDGLIAGPSMALANRWLSAAVLAAAGLYQLSPLKNACLAHCRSPASFFSRHWRPGVLGAVRLGGMHGAYCLGCCWLLMALLFFGGVMNLVWIAALSALVLAEKLFPGGRWIGRASGVVLLAWAGVVAFT